MKVKSLRRVCRSYPCSLHYSHRTLFTVHNISSLSVLRASKLFLSAWASLGLFVAVVHPRVNTSPTGSLKVFTTNQDCAIHPFAKRDHSCPCRAATYSQRCHQNLPALAIMKPGSVLRTYQGHTRQSGCVYSNEYVFRRSFVGDASTTLLDRPHLGRGVTSTTW